MLELPRHVISKKLASGAIAYYYNVPMKYRKQQCPVSNEPLGKDYALMKARAEVLKRYAHRIVNEQVENEASTNVQNEASERVQNEKQRFWKSV
jgi:hypothetical protein